MNKFVLFIRTVRNVFRAKKKSKKPMAKNETPDIYHDPSIRVNYRGQ